MRRWAEWWATALGKDALRNVLAACLAFGIFRQEFGISNSVFTVPRGIRLEYKLSRLCQENAPLDRILPEIKKSMDELSAAQEEIGGPFSYAVINEEGFKEVS